MSIQANFPATKVNFQVGDRVRWYRRSGPLTGTVLKFTPKRVQILAEMPDGRLKIRYVTARRLAKLVPQNKNYGRNPSVEFMSKEVQRRVNRIGPTLAWQTFSALVTLILAGLLITIITIIGEEYLINPGGGALRAEAIYSSLGLIILTVKVIQNQYVNSLTPGESFRVAMQYSGWGLLGAISIFGFSKILNFLTHGVSAFYLIWSIVEILVLVVSFTALGLVIGGVQQWRLTAENFDVGQHQLLLSHRAAITACQFGVMPYRARISAFWIAMSASLFAFLGWWVTAIVWQQGDINFAVILVIVSLFLTVMSLQYFEFVFLSPLDSLESYVTEKKIQIVKGNSIYLLVCKGRKFTTDAETWGSVRPGQEYLLWYAPLGFAGAKNRVVAAKPRSSF